MEHVSNERKAMEIADKHKQECYYAAHGDLDDSFEECYQSATEAMKWKEQQLIDKCKEFCNRQTIGEYYNRRGVFQIDKYIDDMLNFIKGR